MNLPEDDLPHPLATDLIDAAFSDDPSSESTILLVGDAPELAGALSDWAHEHGRSIPAGLAIEHGDRHAAPPEDQSPLQFFSAEFVTSDFGQFEYVIVSPPHALARNLFDIAELRDRFPQLHGSATAATVFLLHALDHLTADGRLTILLPPRFLSSHADRQVRRLVAEEYRVAAIRPVEDDEEPFSAFILVIDAAGSGPTETPNGTVELPTSGENWGPAITGVSPPSDTDITLADVTDQIGPGIATGADDVFIMDHADLPPQIEDAWVYPIVGGSTLVGGVGAPIETPLRVICPYDEEGTIVPFDRLGEGVQAWLKLHEDTLRSRASIEGRGTPWYGWTHRPPLKLLRRPKILTRDFATEIEFWLDEAGEVIPRRTVYYMIPDASTTLHELYDYLQSEDVRNWLEATSIGGDRGHRMSMRDLQNLPVPEYLIETSD